MKAMRSFLPLRLMITTVPMTVPSVWIGSVPFVNRQSVEAICLSTPQFGVARPGDDNSITNATKTCPSICFLSFHVALFASRTLTKDYIYIMLVFHAATDSAMPLTQGAALVFLY